MRIALFPGSFDPLTLGHYDLVQRATALFDKVVVAVGVNSQKKTMFSEADRLAMLNAAFAGMQGVEVRAFHGLAVECAADCGAQFMLRGLRTGNDLEYEKGIALVNKHLSAQVETVFLLAGDGLGAVSSTLVREVIRYKGDLHGLVPDSLIPMIYG